MYNTNKEKLEHELKLFLKHQLTIKKTGLPKRIWIASIKGYFGFTSDKPAESRLDIMIYNQYLITNYEGYKINPTLINKLNNM